MTVRTFCEINGDEAIEITPQAFIRLDYASQQEVLTELRTLHEKCLELHRLGVIASPMDPVSNIVRDTSEQRAVPGGAGDMADLLFIIEWMYWSGGMMFGKDKEVDNAIARVKNSLTRSGIREERCTAYRPGPANARTTPSATSSFTMTASAMRGVSRSSATIADASDPVG